MCGKEHHVLVTNPRESLQLWKTAKIITMSITRNRSLNPSVHCILVLESPRKAQCSQSLDGKLCLRRKETEQDQLNSGHWLPIASGFLLAANEEQLAYWHSSYIAAEEPCYSLLQAQRPFLCDWMGLKDSMHWTDCLFQK